jgi:DNA-binding CsgD family transcriptional regulator
MRRERISYRRHQLEGQTFTRLTVLRRDDGNKGAYLCKCDCGTEIVAFPWFLLAGKVKSCGCLRRDRMSSEGYRATQERNAMILKLSRAGKMPAEIAAILGIERYTVSGVKQRDKIKRKKERARS